MSVSKMLIVSAIRKLGLSCTYSSVYSEFIINYKLKDARWTEDSAYYTTYTDDALETAKVMAAYKQEAN
jgi:hypothetical protein